MIARYRHLRAACSVGKWPRALTARRSRALIDSIALGRADHGSYFPVELQERHELGRGVLPEPDDGRVAFLPRAGELGEPVEGLGLGRRGIYRLEPFGDKAPVSFRGVLE
jgi:hypothetical protein